jgi:hypothetical protein
VPELKLSDDGLYYWDGQQWVSTLSHDGGSRWNGVAWVPVAGLQQGSFQPHARVRVPTGWTKPLQYSVVAWYLANAIWAVATPFIMGGTVSDYVNQAIQQNAALNPDVPPPPADVIATIHGVITVVFGIAAAVGVAIAAVAIIGALKRWTWVFYAVLVLLGLQTISFPFTVISAFTTSAFSPMKLPFALTATSIAFGVPAVALFAWMMVAAFRRGPWGMTRVPPS